jgi:hypothetical protein
LRRWFKRFVAAGTWEPSQFRVQRSDYGMLEVRSVSL